MIPLIYCRSKLTNPPTAVMLSVARSRYALPSQFTFLLVNAVGLLVGIIYNNQSPDLYENNAHHKIGWVATWAVGVQFVLTLIFFFAGRGESKSTACERATFLPVSTDETVETLNTYPPGALHAHRWSRDSGQGTERNSSSLHSPDSTACESSSEDYDHFEKPEDPAHEPAEPRGWLHNTFFGRFMASRVPGLVSNRVLRAFNVVYMIIDRIILLLGFATIATGGVTYGGIMVRVHPW